MEPIKGPVDFERTFCTRAGSRVDGVQEWFDGRLIGFYYATDDDGNERAYAYIWNADGSVIPDHTRSADLMYVNEQREGEGPSPLQVA